MDRSAERLVHRRFFGALKAEELTEFLRVTLGGSLL